MNCPIFIPFFAIIFDEPTRPVFASEQLLDFLFYNRPDFIRFIDE
jgi:hypothetical protein